MVLTLMKPLDQITPRSGPELIRATQPFEVESRVTTWLLLAETIFALAAALLLVFLVEAWPVKILVGIIAGLVQVRLFIFYHDTLHGAIFRKDPIGNSLMTLVGFYLVVARSVWKESHDYHHTNNAKLIGSAIGSYPIMTVDMHQRASTGDLRLYNFARHPLTIFFGYFTVFLIGFSLHPFFRNPKRHWGGPVALILPALLLAVVWINFGWINALAAVFIPCFVSMLFGAYLFYAQHNFPGVKIPKRGEWSYTEAAISASSMFKMSWMMHWFTGNIGFHHVHHLNHRIPFYLLPQAMAAIPELQTPSCTSWRLRDIIACLRLSTWDPKQDRMLTYAEMKQLSATL